MKGFRLFLILALFISGQALAAAQFNQSVLEAIKAMPTAGGYELTSAPVKKLRDAFNWQTDGSDELLLNPALAKPSFCTTATYLIFYKALQQYWLQSGMRPSRQSLELLKPNLEKDGLKIWGRWNSNGPGSAKLFYDAKLGINFDDIQKAEPGDFLKIFWSQDVGKKEKGHTVIYLGREIQNGVEMIKFWGSNTSTQGYGIKYVTRKSAVKTLFTRLTHPENLENITALPAEDKYLASMLTKISNWKELKATVGVE